MQYFHVLNRQLVNQNANNPRWSQMYAGSMIGGQQVHGLVISSTVAVYNESSSNATSSLLGVVGTDVPIDSLLKKFIKPHLLGPNAYAFLTTVNGFVTIHPDLKVNLSPVAKKSDQVKLRKNYRSISILSIENLTPE